MTYQFTVPPAPTCRLVNRLLVREVKRPTRDMHKMEQNVHPPTDVFKRHFDIPSLPSNLVFDFESFDDDNCVSTPESILLNSVLHLGLRGNLQGASALGTHGMGGVGKTTALKRICSAESVKGRFVDGVCFMEFGQDAALQKVREEMCRCVRNFGGVEAAKDMGSAPTLGNVVNRAAEWLKGKAVLLVCDDLWATDDKELGYVLELKKMLREAPKSGLLISTRDRTIANAVSSSPVSFECAQPEGPRARKILGKSAFGDSCEEIISNWNAESEYVEILRVCAGLPLALGIAGSGVKLNYLDSKDASFSVVKYWRRLKRGGLNQLKGANAEYHASGLKYVVEASLELCELWGSSGGRNLNMRRLFRSLCVLEKQQLMPESILEQYWALNELQMSEVVEKFTNLYIVKRDLLKRSININSKISQFHVYMHDLVLELCQEMVVGEENEWHLRLINAYRMTLEDDEEMETQPKDWWNVKDDGCVYENLSRHLVASGLSIELEALLCDVRWTLRRYEVGGWAALDLDFKRLLAHQGCSVGHGICKLRSLLKRCWDWLRSDRSLFAFYVFGHLSKQERQERFVSEYLKSVTEHFPSPWLYPLAKCVGPEDNRESSRWNIGDVVTDLAVSWSTDRVSIGSLKGIHVWSLSRQEELVRISIDRDAIVRCVELSEDANIIVSGHDDATVRCWNVNTGACIRKPMSRHTKGVRCVAIRGNLIVSGSDDGMLYRWNVTTGESIGSALQGHKALVSCVAVSADSKLIVSGSKDGTIRRWDAGTGYPVGSSLKTRHEVVTSLAISSDGELIVSGHEDGTIRRWIARTGEAVGEPLLGHNGWISDVAVSEDRNCIVSCSVDGDVRLWGTLSGGAIGIPLRGHGGSVSCVAISRNCKFVLSGCLHGTVRQWDVSAERNVTEQHLLLTSPDELHSNPIREVITSLSVCANGKLAVSGSADGTVQRWDMLTGEAMGRPMLGHARKSWVCSVAISRDGTLIVSGDSDGMVRRWDASTGEAMGETMDGHGGVVSAVVISDDGKLIVTGSWDRTVRRWDAGTGEAIEKPIEVHSVDDLILTISTDGNLIVSVWRDGMQLWNATSGEQIGGDIDVPCWVDKIVISNDGETIACGSEYDDYVQRWETKTGKPICEPMKWSEGKYMLEEIERARLCGDQQCNALGRKDTFPIETWCTAVCPDKEKIAVGLKNGSVAVCERR